MNHHSKSNARPSSHSRRRAAKSPLSIGLLVLSATLVSSGCQNAKLDMGQDEGLRQDHNQENNGGDAGREPGAPNGMGDDAPTADEVLSAPADTTGSTESGDEGDSGD